MSQTERFLSNNHIISMVVPVADFNATGVTTNEVCMSRWDHATFLVVTGANASADEPHFVVQSCADTSATGATAIGFDYSETDGETQTNRNDWADYTRKTSAGYQTNTASAVNLMYIIEVDAAELSATAGINHEYVRLVMTESGSTGVTGCVICILSDPRFSTDPSQHADETA